MQNNTVYFTSFWDICTWINILKPVYSKPVYSDSTVPTQNIQTTELLTISLSKIWTSLPLFEEIPYEPAQNLQNRMCAQQILRSAWVSPQSDQSSLCAQWVAKNPSFLHVDSKGWSDWADAQADLSLLHARHFIAFVMNWLIFILVFRQAWVKQCIPRSDTVFCTIWSVSRLFTTHPAVFNPCPAE